MFPHPLSWRFQLFSFSSSPCWLILQDTCYGVWDPAPLEQFSDPSLWPYLHLSDLPPPVWPTSTCLTYLLLTLNSSPTHKQANTRQYTETNTHNKPTRPAFLTNTLQLLTHYHSQDYHSYTKHSVTHYHSLDYLFLLTVVYLSNLLKNPQNTDMQLRSL